MQNFKQVCLKMYKMGQSILYDFKKKVAFLAQIFT